MSSTSISIDHVPLELSVLIGEAQIPIHQLLRMGRGAVVMLDARVDDTCRVYVNGQIVAQGEVMDLHGTLGIYLTEMIIEPR